MPTSQILVHKCHVALENSSSCHLQHYSAPKFTTAVADLQLLLPKLKSLETHCSAEVIGWHVVIRTAYENMLIATAQTVCWPAPCEAAIQLRLYRIEPTVYLTHQRTARACVHKSHT
jgi:hypothetical protein